MVNRHALFVIVIDGVSYPFLLRKDHHLGKIEEEDARVFVKSRTNIPLEKIEHSINLLLPTKATAL